ncbi:chemotaxis protein CheC [Alteromonas sp. KUL42]|uniref:chemotaxis protein CheX n=1 Tax=Alteromonas sp. KUL42 TaxID=2480797 RepID=UPI0010363674|nr:chemotaxis protein CheX [Alteromonas sp. KUL42]TAP37423.1 chemotaxis protein CheC [Alteromonas sp. KUL42]GEA05814.1 chemotaxis protein CheC [Alteromonas sp. KUL42]
MSKVLSLNSEQQDALQELLNISMGQAANSLAQLIETKIDISIPKISAVTPTQLFSLLFETENAYYTRQSFLGNIHGEVMSVISRSGLSEVAELMDYDEPLSKHDIQEIILELCNILAGACLSGLSEQLELITNLNMPTLFQPKKANFDELNWQHSLVMEVQFEIAISSFIMRVVFCLDDVSLSKIKTTLDEILE